MDGSGDEILRSVDKLRALAAGFWLSIAKCARIINGGA